MAGCERLGTPACKPGAASRTPIRDSTSARRFRAVLVEGKSPSTPREPVELREAGYGADEIEQLRRAAVVSPEPPRTPQRSPTTKCRPASLKRMASRCWALTAPACRQDQRGLQVRDGLLVGADPHRTVGSRHEVGAAPRPGGRSGPSGGRAGRRLPRSGPGRATRSSRQRAGGVPSCRLGARPRRRPPG